MQDTNLFKRHEQAVADLILSAKQNLTAPSGSQVFHSDLSDPDNDVTTVVGPAAGAAGVAQWVGDTTPPGVPTGVTATSKQGIVYVAWDGTLDGGVPEDFGQVNLLVDGAPVGHLLRAGTLPVDGLTAGATVQVTATAQDLARAQDGTPAPNVSAACAPVSVTVESAVSQADLDNAQAQIDQAKTDITAAQNTANSALTTATSANSTATAASTAASQAQTTANGKNKVFTQTAEPSHTGLVQGDLWRVLTVMGDGSRQVTGQQVWNGTAFVADRMVADSILVPGSTGTVSIGDGAITTPKLLAGQIDANTVLATNSVTAAKISATVEMLTKILSARKINADEIDVGALAAAIVTSTDFHTSNGLLGFDETNGFWAKNSSGAYLFQVPVDASGVLMVGGIKTALTGNRVEVTETSQTVNGVAQNVGAVNFYNGTDGTTPAAVQAQYQKTTENGAQYSGDAATILSGGGDNSGNMQNPAPSIALNNSWWKDGTGSVFTRRSIAFCDYEVLSLSDSDCVIHRGPYFDCYASSLASLKTGYIHGVVTALQSAAGGGFSGDGFVYRGHVWGDSTATNDGDYVFTGGAWVPCRRVLFNNDSQPLSGGITLSETAADFGRLEIYFRSDDNAFASTTVYNPNGKLVSLFVTAPTFGGLVAKGKVVKISGTSIDTYTPATGQYWTGYATITPGGSSWTPNSDEIGITQVIGYND